MSEGYERTRQDTAEFLLAIESHDELAESLRLLGDISTLFPNAPFVVMLVVLHMRLTNLPTSCVHSSCRWFCRCNVNIATVVRAIHQGSEFTSLLPLIAEIIDQQEAPAFSLRRSEPEILAVIRAACSVRHLFGMEFFWRPTLASLPPPARGTPGSSASSPSTSQTASPAARPMNVLRPHSPAMSTSTSAETSSSLISPSSSFSTTASSATSSSGSSSSSAAATASSSTASLTPSLASTSLASTSTLSLASRSHDEIIPGSSLLGLYPNSMPLAAPPQSKARRRRIPGDDGSVKEDHDRDSPEDVHEDGNPQRRLRLDRSSPPHQHQHQHQHHHDAFPAPMMTSSVDVSPSEYAGLTNLSGLGGGGGLLGNGSSSSGSSGDFASQSAPGASSSSAGDGQLSGRTQSAPVSTAGSCAGDDVTTVVKEEVVQGTPALLPSHQPPPHQPPFPTFHRAPPELPIMTRIPTPGTTPFYPDLQALLDHPHEYTRIVQAVVVLFGGAPGVRLTGPWARLMPLRDTFVALRLPQLGSLAPTRVPERSARLTVQRAKMPTKGCVSVDNIRCSACQRGLESNDPPVCDQCRLRWR